MNFTTLTSTKSTTGSIPYWLNFDNIDATGVLRDAENWINQHLRVRRMQARATLTLSDGENSIDLSSDVPSFLDPIRLYAQGYGEICLTHEGELDYLRATDTDGDLAEDLPTYWVLIGETIYFDTEADQDYTLFLTYYSKPTALSASNETNLYTDTYPALLRAVCMGFGYLEAKDENRAGALFDSARRYMAQIAVNDDLARRSAVYNVEVS